MSVYSPYIDAGGLLKWTASGDATGRSCYIDSNGKLKLNCGAAGDPYIDSNGKLKFNCNPGHSCATKLDAIYIVLHTQFGSGVYPIAVFGNRQEDADYITWDLIDSDATITDKYCPPAPTGYAFNTALHTLYPSKITWIKADLAFSANSGAWSSERKDFSDFVYRCYLGYGTPWNSAGTIILNGYTYSYFCRTDVSSYTPSYSASLPGCIFSLDTGYHNYSSMEFCDSRT